MEIIYNIGKIITIILVLSISIYFFIIIRKSQTTETVLMKEKNILLTNDLKVSSIISSGFLDRGNEYSYCRFQINTNKSVCLYFRFTQPKDVYYGPFLLLPKNSVSVKNLIYYVEKFEREKNGNAYLHIKTKLSIISSYRIYINYISEEDFYKIKQSI